MDLNTRAHNNITTSVKVLAAQAAPMEVPYFDVDETLKTGPLSVIGAASKPRVIHVDSNRVDTYTPDGTDNWPYKTFAAAIAHWTDIAGPIAIHAGFGNYSAGGNYTTPAYALTLYANGGTISTTGTITTAADMKLYDLNTSGAVTVTAGTNYILYNGTITGTLTINGTARLHNVTLSVAPVVNSGGTLYYDDTCSIPTPTGAGTVVCEPLLRAAADALKSPLAGSGNIATVGTVTTGVWHGTPVDEGYIHAPASGSWWTGVPRIASDGSLEVGKFIDFHTTSGDTSDYSVRLIGLSGQLAVYGDILGTPTGTRYCGTASFPWSGGYTQTAFTVTSAREAKTAIRDFTAAEKAVAKAIVRTCPRVYQLVTSVAEKGTEARLHSGCVYEEVYQTFLDGGLDPERYSIFCASPRQKKTALTETREVITVSDGKAVVTTESATVWEPVYEALPMVDAGGNALLDESGKPRTHQAPVYETDETGAVKMDKGLRYEELQIWIAAGLREIAATGGAE